jgi:2-hydroxy-3-keto-5-methylthiopentenyl-1-phosphate phosphatase
MEQPMPEAVELLKQNLTIDPDLRNFISFALESVAKLGGWRHHWSPGTG